MQNIAPKKDGYDLIKTNDIVGDHIKFVKHEFLRSSRPADPGDRYAVLMGSASSGAILWEDSKVSDLQACLVSEAGISDTVPEGYNPYTSVMMVDEQGVLCTFTSSSWGGRNAFSALIPQYRMQGKRAYPIVTLGSRPRGNQYGTIDPSFQIVGWAERSKFAAITGDDPSPAPELEAPKPAPEPTAKRSLSDLIGGDDVPF